MVAFFNFQKTLESSITVVYKVQGLLSGSCDKFLAEISLDTLFLVKVEIRTNVIDQHFQKAHEKGPWSCKALMPRMKEAVSLIEFKVKKAQ